eukprot:336620-Hanusia_phi.AAC.1
MEMLREQGRGEKRSAKSLEKTKVMIDQGSTRKAGSAGREAQGGEGMEISNRTSFYKFSRKIRAADSMFPLISPSCHATALLLLLSEMGRLLPPRALFAIGLLVFLSSGLLELQPYRPHSLSSADITSCGSLRSAMAASAGAATRPVSRHACGLALNDVNQLRLRGGGSANPFERALEGMKDTVWGRGGWCLVMRMQGLGRHVAGTRRDIVRSLSL